MCSSLKMSLCTLGVKVLQWFQKWPLLFTALRQHRLCHCCYRQSIDPAKRCDYVVAMLSVATFPSKSMEIMDITLTLQKGRSSKGARHVYSFIWLLFSQVLIMYTFRTCHSDIGTIYTCFIPSPSWWHPIATEMKKKRRHINLAAHEW